MAHYYSICCCNASSVSIRLQFIGTEFPDVTFDQGEFHSRNPDEITRHTKFLQTFP
jgi:hypothetical protein